MRGTVIDSIELVNWKTHGHTKLNFSNGVNILVGSMGAGKSSIMDAISFALFGTYPAIKEKRVATSDIIMSRPEQKESATVRLVFTAEGATYAIERNLSMHGSTKAALSKNGAYLQSQSDRVNEEVEKILKVDYDLFARAVYSEQNRLAYFLELDPSPRKKQMDRLLGLDKFALAQESSGTLINRIKDMIEESDRTIATFDIAKLKERQGALLDEAKGLGKMIEGQKADVQRLTKEKRESEKKLVESKAIYEKKMALTKDLAALRSKLEILNGEIEKITKKGVRDKKETLKALEAAKAAFEKAKTLEKEIITEEKRSRDTLVESETELRTAKRDIEEKERLQKEYGKCDAKALEETFKSDTENLKKERGTYEANVASMNENCRWLKELDKHISRCPICERELSDDARERILKDRRLEVDKLDAENKKQKHKIELLEKGLEKESKEIQRLGAMAERILGYKDIEGKLKSAVERTEKSKQENIKLLRKKDEASETVSKAKDELARLELEKETVERLEGHMLQRDETSKSVSEKEKSLASIEMSQETVERLQDAFTELSTKAKELETKLDSNVRYEKEKLLQVDEKKKEIGTVEKLQAGVAKKRKTVENLTKFKNALLETQALLRTKLIGSINEIMQEVWPELYPYGDYTSIMLEPTAEDYVLKVRVLGDSQRWEEVNAIASGGEKSIACLAMRVAFALVLVPNLKWIILDEPTHNIDQQGLSKLTKAIGEVMPRIVEQVFIITHDEALRQVANARVYTLSRNKEENGETIVETF